MTREAIAAFQADHGLAVTSVIDEPTLATLGKRNLSEVFGSRVMCFHRAALFCKGGTSISTTPLIRSFSWLYSAAGAAEMRAT